MKFKIPALLLFAVVLVAPPGMAVQSPDAVIKEAADEMLQAVDGRQDELRQNLPELYQIVDDILLPRFDRRYSGGLVMGKYWRQASDEQRERFILALYRSLMQTYAEGILDYKGDELEVLPVTDDLADGKAMVETRVTLDTGVITPVNYRMRLSDGSWKAYDVIIEGISYVTNYRKQYSSEFRAKGIDVVIDELEAKSADGSGAAAEPEGGTDT